MKQTRRLLGKKESRPHIDNCCVYKTPIKLTAGNLFESSLQNTFDINLRNSKWIEHISYIMHTLGLYSAESEEEKFREIPKKWTRFFRRFLRMVSVLQPNIANF
ncbi:uncharacterized protein LOC112453200 [Temnothorax curvispinosus]|uniref:Uncharacterized protein LOC112453200 n=1 Tax=Temnothorax curvispinosus TaxID=300111 RepID=A0A6J1PK60_9HYME|nr:uncharacterized protein LOC112453200 [Temnothorax curvispinosus]